MVTMTHWDGATGTEFARDTRVELDIKGEEGPTRDHEKGDGLFRKGAQGERWGGQSKKKMHPGGCHCQFPGYDMGRCYYPGTMLLSWDDVKALSVFIFFPTTACVSGEAGVYGP